ncbi:hypothetical protein FHU38_000760 [Saccharomonospora amisosensis]|uniref:EspG family protein n=1 Tax=Saccharomonospora amisosensis TaxID=1128677 RepID=A0A7X5ULU9_9PSEU|nr:ESX secretion-associated protein EspG [Saccharomonospora amisosensis]NIJ10416.1 hypothetical protein [Saccharomonospora amisosensis]
MTATVGPAVERGARFEPPELDLLAAHAGIRPPFPLRVPSLGRISGEREALLAAAARSLSARGLITRHGPSGVAADLVAALRGHRGAVDLVVIDGGTVTGVVAMIHGPGAVVCHQSIGGAPGPVTVARVTTAALTDELANRIPKTGAAQTMPIALPPGVVGDVSRLLENTAGIAAPRKRIRALVAERGGDESAVDALVDLLPSVQGRGQLGAVIGRAGDRAERPLELSWLDSPKGRIRVNTDDRGWVSINPLRHGELLRVLREAAALARG